MIELENHSPFPALIYEKAGYKNRLFDVLAIKGTFRLKINGSRADLAATQKPLVMTDTYWTENPMASSLRHETDLVLGKLRTDIHVMGHAYSKAGKPMKYWDTAIRVGEMRKTLRVYGPRNWHYWRMFWRMGEAQPVTKVPLRYELAYGGSYIPRRATQAKTFAANPVGRGFYDPSLLDTGKEYPAPQLVKVDEGWLNGISSQSEPQGYGPLSRWWPQRAQYAGTYDEAWKAGTWPHYPSDFNPAFLNSAPTDMQVQGYLKGNEPVELTGLLAQAQNLETALAGYLPICVAEDDRQTLHRFMPRLETVVFDTDACEIRQTWRLTLPREFGLRHVVLGASVPPPERQGELQRIHFPREWVMPRNTEKEKLDRIRWLVGPEDR